MLLKFLPIVICFVLMDVPAPDSDGGSGCSCDDDAAYYLDDTADTGDTK